MHQELLETPVLGLWPKEPKRWLQQTGVEKKELNKKKNTQILISLTIYLPIQPGRQGIQKDSLLQLVKISYLSY